MTAQMRRNCVGLIDKLSHLSKRQAEAKRGHGSKSFHHDPLCGLDKHNAEARPSLNPTDSKEDIAKEAKALFRQHWHGSPVRLLGVTGTDLVNRKEAVKQLDLFSFHEDAKDEPIQKVMAELNEKYGTDLIKKGVRIVKKESKTSGTSFNKDFFQDERQDQ